jgi:hypothetical protein
MPADEAAVTSAALAAYFDEIHGGTAIADAPRRRPALLHSQTLGPTRDQLQVRVFSFANRDAAAHFASAETAQMLADLRARSAKPRRLANAPLHYELASTTLARCGPEFIPRSSSMPSRSRVQPLRRTAPLSFHVEHAGGARAYALVRGTNGWNVAWRVELWACG